MQVDGRPNHCGFVTHVRDVSATGNGATIPVPSAVTTS